MSSSLFAIYHRLLDKHIRLNKDEEMTSENVIKFTKMKTTMDKFTD